MRTSILLVVALLYSNITRVSSLRLPFSTPTLIQPPPPKGFSWAVDVSELEGRVVKINRLVGGRSTGRTAFISPDAARTTTELNRGDSVATRPPTTSLPMSLKLADLARVPLGLVKLVAAELLIVKLVTVELLAVTVAAIAHLVPGVHACASHDAHALAPAVVRPLRFVDALRDGLFPADAILTLGVRPRGRSPALAGAAMAR